MADTPEVVRIFQDSRSAGMPWLPVLHTTDEDLWFFGGQLADGTGWGIDDGGQLVAFAFHSGGWLNHLYVDPDHWGRGHGGALLTHALDAHGRVLRLWAFARNTRAIAFYRHHGFEVIQETDGAGNEEREPDVLMALDGAR